jgi:hypothetical protein
MWVDIWGVGCWCTSSRVVSFYGLEQQPGDDVLLSMKLRIWTSDAPCRACLLLSYGGGDQGMCCQHCAEAGMLYIWYAQNRTCNAQQHPHALVDLGANPVCHGIAVCAAVFQVMRMFGGSVLTPLFTYPALR